MLDIHTDRQVWQFGTRRIDDVADLRGLTIDKLRFGRCAMLLIVSSQTARHADRQAGRGIERCWIDELRIVWCL